MDDHTHWSPGPDDGHETLGDILRDLIAAQKQAVKEAQELRLVALLLALVAMACALGNAAIVVLRL